MHRPLPVDISLLLWSLAIAAGVLETVLALAPVLAADGPGPALLPAIALRCLLYAGAAALVLALALRRRWARPALTVALSIGGLGSMLLPLLADLAVGAPPAPLFLAVRSAHILAVLIATAAMFAPSSSRWLVADAELRAR